MAADEVQWDYAPSGRDEAMGMDFDDIGKAITQSGPHWIGRVYKKAVYHEYTDATFSTLKKRVPDEQYLGILGPVLRGAVGDTIKVVFKNNGTHPFSMHPRGVLYGWQGDRNTCVRIPLVPAATAQGRRTNTGTQRTKEFDLKRHGR